MEPLALLARLLRPAGGGIHLVSTGLAERRALQRQLYGVATDGEVADAHRRDLARIATARAVILGVPSDTGAGFVRGSNLSPLALRRALVAANPALPAWLEAHGVVDAGDVFVVPQLLEDEMVAPAQLARCRAALYPDLPAEEAADLPVSPLTAEARALAALHALNPTAVPVILGGDHSVAGPVARHLAETRAGRWGIVQLDAHTDLLAERLGIRDCFATWAYHANERFGRDGRLVQVGLRASAHHRAHWEQTLGVRQFWAEECRAAPERAIEEVVGHLRERGVTAVYLSNDIDATDAAEAPATGTPEPDGLPESFVRELIRRLGAEFRLVAADLVEVAPALERHPGDGARTLAVAGRYLVETLAACT
jgi:guanidinobutyrase